LSWVVDVDVEELPAVVDPSSASVKGMRYDLQGNTKGRNDQRILVKRDVTFRKTEVKALTPDN
jgi:hypothetical protein